MHKTKPLKAAKTIKRWLRTDICKFILEDVSTFSNINIRLNEGREKFTSRPRLSQRNVTVAERVEGDRSDIKLFQHAFKSVLHDAWLYGSAPGRKEIIAVL